MWRKNLWTLVAAVILAGSSYTMIIPFLPLYLLELGVGQSNVKMWSGVVFASTFLVAALMAPYWGRRADRSGKRRMIMRAGIMLSLAYFVGAWVRTPVELIGVRIFQGFSSGFVPASMALVASSAPPEKLGFCMGIMQTAVVIGGIVGPLMGGTLSHLFGMRMAFIVAGVILSVGTVAVGWLVVEPERMAAPPETSLMDDLKTALDESCELLMHQPYCVKSLTLMCAADKDGLRVTLSAQRCDEKQEEEPADADVAGLIIGTLVKEVRLSRDEGGVCGVDMLLPARTHGC